MSIPVSKIILSSDENSAVIYACNCKDVWKAADDQLSNWVKKNPSNNDYRYVIVYADGYRLEGTEKISIGCRCDLKERIKNAAHYYAGKSCPQHMSDSQYNLIIADRKNSMQRFVSTYEH